MFEAHVLHLLRKYLGEYVEGLSTEALRISVWQGDVVLKDLKLKAEALNSLKLPVTVKAGFVGTITLKVPWKSLGKEPVVVLIDRVFVLAHPAPAEQTLKEEDREKIFEAKLQQIEDAELATLEAVTGRSKAGTASDGNSWLGSLIATIIGNLKVTISHVHIRYEDSISNPGHPFCSGVTLSKLAAVTTDEQGNETFDTSGALDNLRKSLQLQRLAVYHDTDSIPWKVDKNWEDLDPSEWTQIFQDGIDEVSGEQVVSIWAMNRKYLVSPINGVLIYHRLGKQERQNPEIPFEKASLVLSDVSLTMSEAQYYDGIKLLETCSRYKTHVDVSHLRPVVPISEDCHAWWRYAMLASLQQKKMCYWFSWERIKHLCQLRRSYVQMYANSLQQVPNVEISELRQIERVLDSKVILLWRLLAHARIKSVKSKEASKQKNNLKRSWWSLGWRTAPGEDSDASVSPESRLAEEERLTKEEWQAINKMLSYQQDDNTGYLHGKDLQNMVQFLVDVSVGQAAARIISINQTEIVCGRFEELHVRTKMYHKSIHCDVSLKFYGLSSPEGSLTQSVISETKTNAVEASFVYLPVGEDVDWRLSANIAPCHATILMESYERFLEFVKRSNAVSPTVAMETATVLQMKIEQVTRRAQEQLQLVLEEQSRFALDVDFDAPKVRIPVKAGKSESKFIVDFGHFTLYTREGQPDERRKSLYSRFYISGRDMAAFFIDGTLNEKSSSSLDHGSQMLPLHTSDDVSQLYYLLDRCGMSVIVDQIKIPHPCYPSTRVSVQVPNLGIHISPKRYRSVMELLNIFYSTMEIGDQDANVSLQPGSVPWLPADLATDARILVWRGIGYTLAEWKPCYLVLSGLYLYVLESEVSQNYQRCCSMVGRQVFEVSPASAGGSLYAVAVSSRGCDVQKALESTSTLIIELRDSEEKTAWLKELVQATYRASAPPTIDILGEQIYHPQESVGPRHSNLRAADLVVNGSLVETKLYIYGKSDEKYGNADQELIIEILACGGKVNVHRLGGDLTVKMKLHSLKIKDELQSRLSNSPQYLARSVFNENKKPATCTVFDLSKKSIDTFFLEEDDTFKDALPDFMSISDPSFYSSELICDFSSPDLCERYTRIGCADASSHERDPVKGKVGEIFYEAADSNIPDFVSVTFMTRSPGSPLYDGIDTQMCIRMSALEFFCNRPTLVALIGFGFDLSLASSAVSEADDMVVPKFTERKEENNHSLVTGLLGYGKGRVVFNLRMDVDSFCVFLNKEDGSQLAMFVQESFILDLKVHPSSTSIEGTLGNMRLCDMSLGPDHRWGWLCDIRNQGSESLIKFKFQSYSVGDDDYEGYDYSLTGRLSAVRIVFLYRFVLEITTYFMELASPHTEEAIKLVDKVGGFEWLIQKYEMDGAAAVKVNLSLDTPIIIVPKNSTSEDYMQLDLGQLQVKNNFSWHGCKENDPSAVYLDILDAEIHGINMAVGVGGHMGKPLIREGKGIHIQVRRSLRDVFRKVPTISIEVKVGLLHCVMSDKEYNVIVNCVYLNLSEQPRLPPSFRYSATGTKESMRMFVDKVNPYGQKLLASTIVVIAVEVDYALLELCNGLDEESPLAQILLEGLWVVYRTTSMFEMDLYVSIPKFSILDIRPDTKPEMRLMLGSYADVSKPGLYNASCSSRTGRVPSVNDCVAENLECVSGMDVSNLTMLVMDYRWRSSFQSFVIRVQQPRVLVVLDFLLAVAEFFVPWLGAITGREESLHSENDPLKSCDDIILSEPVYMQEDDVVRLSPRRQLIVDGFGTDEFIYDGCGGTISLTQEIDTKGQSSHSGTIIVIGRGKKLRFKNVKFENGALLRKCIYLCNESSYSVSADDGVEISLLENIPGGSDKEALEQYQGCTMQESRSNLISGDNSSQLRNVTFEAQVMSSELTFYDSSKLSSDSTMHVEKLLRVKMDLSFMYASKENDTWARSLVKDLTIEAGSGLVILEPVDISGGYTSVKDKTNISVISTDICIHLPLNVASLMLQLQEQATVALQFGNANPLASCTNFKRVWVSPKVSGDLPGYTLTFWRPQAPSNYAILGDCVTSRAIPPSQVVVAVSNTYGRVRKPTGFKLIGSFSKLQGMEEQCRLNSNLDCSIWMPIPPPGYLAMGCVAHVGNQPPPTHIVYCLRSDLAASACFSDCMFYVPPNSSVSSGFSVWNIDNVAGSFYAITSVEFPPKFQSFDLHQILLHNHNRQHSLTNHPSSNTSIDKDLKSQQEADSSSNTSGWDILRTLSKSGSCYMSTPHFERVWWDRGCDLRKPISIWRPIPRPGFAALADCITEGLEPPGLGLVFKCDDSVISAKPVQFTKVAQVNRKGVDEAFFWYPIPPPGYASMGCVVTRTDEAPNKDTFCCPRIDLVTQANISDQPISSSSNSKGSNSWSIWKIENQGYTFLARSDHRKPSSRLAYNISDYIKPRTRENVSAELKVDCLSLSILDSFCGTMTPLIDTTVANISLASHGRLEAMNAVLICSFAASTFNRQTEEWEPLVEPFDGIFKLETYIISECPPSKVGKRVRIAVASTLNVNVSAANLETLIELVASWRRQNIVDPRLSNEESDENEKKFNDLSFSALEEDDFQKVTVENKMGCDIYLRKVEQVSDNVILLPRDNEAQLLIPPPRFSDRLNVVAKSRETRFYVAVQISESKDLPLVDDGNSNDFFCALRVLIDSKVSNQWKLFPQSARTRCARPSISKIDGLNVGHAKWNELFIFEVPEKGLANLEIEVTNLALKAGKGEVVGALSIPIGAGAVTLKRAASIRALQHAAATDLQKISQYPLRKKGQLIANEDKKHYGTLILSTSYFERSAHVNFQKGTEDIVDTDSDVGFWVGLSPYGPWESFGSMLPLSVVPKSLDKKPFAFEVVMRNGKKHAILRALALIVNCTDVKLEVSVCPASISNSLMNLGSSSTPQITEEIFENERYSPIPGWGKKSGFHSNDPKRWSTRDLSYSSKDFFEPALPSGWKWTSAWKLDKSQFVDGDGWAYGADFQTLNWPPSASDFSSQTALDCVRRRRWIRTRQKLPDTSISSLRNVIAVINPGSSDILPWTSMAKEADMCLQVRPYAEGSQEAYTWSQIITLNSFKDQIGNQKAAPAWPNTLKNLNILLPNSVLKLDKLEKKDLLMYCNPITNAKQNLWLSVGTDASVLHTELNAPIFDWKISINATIKLENKLPCEAEYAIWEKKVEGNMVERQPGIISASGSAFIYNADLRRPIYLTLFVQGGWVLEEDAILIMDVPATGRTSFWMIQQQTNRRLRVSIEYDMGGSDAAPKTLRLFVPYWLCNDSSIPLSYRVVEVESLDNTGTDSQTPSKAVKSAKFALRHSSKSMDRKFSTSRRNLQILEVIEDLCSNCVMLSPQDYTFPSGSAPSRDVILSSNRVGISIAVHHSESYSAGISLLELERKERVDVKAFASDGSYFNLSAQLKMDSDRTKVVHFLPQTLIINRLGCSVSLCQCNTELAEWIHPNDPPKLLKWKSSARNELLKLRLDGYKWSTPFSIHFDGIMCVCIKTDKGNDQMHIRVEVRGGTKSSRYEVVIQPASLSSPYRIENLSTFLPIRFRQVDGMDDSWLYLLPNSAASFYWEDLGRRRLLEVLADGMDPLKSEKYNIDEVMDHQPLQSSSGPMRALRLTVIKEGKVQICRISDWMPDNETPVLMHLRVPSPIIHPSQNDSKQSSVALESEFHITFELADLGLSIIDHMPEEILYFSVQTLLLSYSSGLDSGISRFKLRMHSIQIDNQLPFTQMPVLFGPVTMDDQLDYILKFSVTMQGNNSLDFCVYPYLGLQVPESSSFLVNIHEPIIWRLHEMFNQVKFGSIFGSTPSAVSVDPIIKIGLLNISEIRFKVTMAMSPAQRPRGVLGFWSSLMTALGNTEHMPVRIAQRFREEVCMCQSALISTAVSNVQKDLLSRPLQLLSGVDILGNASSALSNMSKGVAALSMDKKFIQSRQKQDSKGIEDIGDVIREGGGAVAKGLFRGLTGIVTKPYEGAVSSGVEGFVQGVGKGIIGAAAQPVSGVLDFLSKTTEGANAMRMKITSAITSEEKLLRRRLPRVISGDNLVRPYDEYKATGQVILQMAESGAWFQVDLFKVRGKFALSDAYEDHFTLRKGKILLITHRRILLLQQPTNIIGQRKFNPAVDRCSVMWDVSLEDLATMELTHGRKDYPGSPPSHLVLYLQSRSLESKVNSRVVKCIRGSQQAHEIYSSIEQTLKTYGPNGVKIAPKRKVPRPYTPSSTVMGHEIMPKEVFGMWSVQEDQKSVPMNSVFGAIFAEPQPMQLDPK